MDTAIKKQMVEKINASLEHLKVGLSGVRTGRASLVLFESLMVNYYGTPTPLKQVASLATPESRLVTISPWDVSAIPEIEKAIMASKMGLTPQNDGKIVRIPIPLLTEDKRKDLVKVVKKMGEECKVTIRNLRRESNDSLKALQKEGSLSEDQVKKSQEEAQKTTDQAMIKVEETVRKKEEEILQV
ncbi:MAG: ribosome recycling factor [Nitrospirae bacterium]|nr:ribosome recycling factor [Candidatus Troglogloeales bacterium]MBI3598214.1 ribosome recycling factor [Candidatus Troglogloeales bacterium]